MTDSNQLSLSLDALDLGARAEAPIEAADVATTAELRAILSRKAVVGIGVSGGKDSHCCALATIRYLDQIGHRGPRVAEAGASCPPGLLR